MACAFCRKRKLRCNEARPGCSNCTRLSKQCEYYETTTPPPKRGTKRSNVGGLEEQLVSYNMQTDGALRNPNAADYLSAVNVFAQYSRHHQPAEPPPEPDSSTLDETPDESDAPETPFGSSYTDAFLFSRDESPETSPPPEVVVETLEIVGRDTFRSWVKEDMEAELTELFFAECYPNIPIIHKTRYCASLHSTPALQPPMCLRYAMWALAAIQTEKWSHLANSFYEKAREYLEQDELRAEGTEVLNVAHVQCWSLIATYESYMLLTLRTWSSIRRAAALANVLRLHTMDESEDADEPDVSLGQLLPDTQDPFELEERRRAFWSAFSSDRWISSSTGYPMTIIERNITTRLPSSEHSFTTGSIETTQSLPDALDMGLDSKTSIFGARAVLACVLGRVMQHVKSGANASRISGSQPFWAQHAKLDELLQKVSHSRSAKLRPSSTTTDMKLWAIDLWLDGLTICLHEAAVDRATVEGDHNRKLVSWQRCRHAADTIVQSIRAIAHLEARKMDPFTASCVYMAANVLIHGDSRGNSRSTDIDDLRFLQGVLEIMHKHWKVTEIFITQFNEDLAKTGINLMITPSEDKEPSFRKRPCYFSPSPRCAPSERLFSNVLPV